MMRSQGRSLIMILCSVKSKNIERGRNSSCYIALCAKSVGNFTTVTDRQLFGFGNLWFYTFIKDICFKKCYSIHLVKILQQSIHKMWKNNNIIFQLNKWKLFVGYPQTMHDPSCCWQHKSCYSNILLVCLSSVKLYNRVFPKCFHWIRWFQWQKYLPLKGIKPATFCVRDQDAATVRDRTLNFSLIRASVIYQIPWIRWIQ